MSNPISTYDELYQALLVLDKDNRIHVYDEVFRIELDDQYDITVYNNGRDEVYLEYNQKGKQLTHYHPDYREAYEDLADAVRNPQKILEQLKSDIEASRKNTNRGIIIYLGFLALLFVLVGLLSGCSVGEYIENATDNQADGEEHVINGIEYHYNNQFYADTVTQLLTCIDDGDKEGVRTLLCDALKNDECIDENIDALVDGFEGDIISVTEYGQSSVGSASYGEDYTSAFLSNSFYITTDEQVYSAYVAICPLDEKHEDGEDIVGIYVIHIETLDYDSGDRERPDFESIEVAKQSCYVQAFYGDSRDYLPVQSAMNRDGIVLYRILPNAGEGGRYEDMAGWDSRDYDSFQTVFGEPYAACTRNDMKSDITDGYIYKLTDSEMYAAITVYRDTGLINTLRIIDINAYRNDEEDEIILEHEE